MKIIQKLSHACLNILCILFFCFFSFIGIKIEAYSTIEAIIPVSCLDILDSDQHIYQIAIESEDDTAPQPKSNILTVTDDGMGEFIIEITEPGTYLYKIYEKLGTDEDITYDNTIYDVTLFVINDNKNGLIYSVSVNISGNSSKSDRVFFKDIISGDKIVSRTNITDICSETTVTTTTESIDITIVSNTSLNNDDNKDNNNNNDNNDNNNNNDITSTNDTITNLIGSAVTGDFTPIKFLFIMIGTSIIIAFIMMIIKKENERRQ